MPSEPAALARVRLQRAVARLRERDIGVRFVTVGAQRVFVDSLDRYAAALAWKLRLRDGPVQRLIAREVESGMTAVDVGANVGWYTLALARQVGPRGRVLALEPDARCFELLRRGIAGNRCAHVEARLVAAAEYSGWTTLYRSAADLGDHRLVPAAEERPAHTVRGVSLDELLADAPRIDFVKLAVQGAEVSVLRGLRQTLARHPELRVLCAVAPSLLERAGASAAALFDPLRSAGLQPHQIGRAGAAEPIHPADAWSLARAVGRVMLYFRRPT